MPVSGEAPASRSAPADDRQWFGPAPYDARALGWRRRVMLFTVLLAVTLLVVKAAAFWFTGSKALFSDALESVVNVITGGFGLFSVWLAGRPPDRSHPYGHGKIEFFAAGLQGAMILAAAAAVFRESAPRLIDPRPIVNLGLGLILAAGAGMANAVVGLILERRGRRVASATLAGEGRHLLTDAVTTAGVIGGLLLVRFTGWLILDPLLACAVAVWIAWSGLGLLRESASRLMDRSDRRLLEMIARALAAVRRPEWIETHLLRAWRSGDFVHIDFHLMFPRWWDIERIHSSQQELLAILLRAIAHPGEVMIHVDPCVPDLCSHCNVAPCAVRSTAFQAPLESSVEALTGGPLGAAEDSCQMVQAEASREITRRALRGGGVDGRW